MSNKKHLLLAVNDGKLTEAGDSVTQVPTIIEQHKGEISLFLYDTIASYLETIKIIFEDELDLEEYKKFFSNIYKWPKRGSKVVVKFFKNSPNDNQRKSDLLEKILNLIHLFYNFYPVKKGDIYEIYKN